MLLELQPQTQTQTPVSRSNISGLDGCSPWWSETKDVECGQSMPSSAEKPWNCCLIAGWQLIVSLSVHWMVPSSPLLSTVNTATCKLIECWWELWGVRCEVGPQPPAPPAPTRHSATSSVSVRLRESEVVREISGQNYFISERSIVLIIK